MCCGKSPDSGEVSALLIGVAVKAPWHCVSLVYSCAVQSENAVAATALCFDARTLARHEQGT